jgi:hypothetical protein
LSSLLFCRPICSSCCCCCCCCCCLLPLRTMCSSNLSHMRNRICGLFYGIPAL